MTSSQHLQQASQVSKTEDEFARLQYQQAIETYRTQLSLLVQIMTVLVLADATVAGYAITTQIASVWLIGALFPMIIRVVSIIALRLMAPVLLTAVSVERKYRIDGVPLLASTFISATITPQYLRQLMDICDITDPEELRRKLDLLPKPSFTMKGSRFIRDALVAIAIGQILVALICWLLLGWRLY